MAFLFAREVANRVGLAAGYDRDAEHLAHFHAWGFGLVEVGTVTPHPIPGHNAGVDALARRLHAGRRNAVMIGANLGAQPGCDVQQAWGHYLRGMRALARCTDYLVVNLTGEPGNALLAARNQGAFSRMLHALHDERCRCSGPALLLKLPLAAVLADDASILRAAHALAFDGVIVVRRGQEIGPVARLARLMPVDMAMIVAGGIESPDQAMACARAGADLVQIHRAFAVRGPQLVRSMAAALAGPTPAAPLPFPQAKVMSMPRLSKT